jgi:hypothetical protein
MGDRCYIAVTCRRADLTIFEELGFAPDEYGPADGLLVEMTDEEANLAHTDQLPTHVPFLGWSGPGDNYGPYLFACDGQQFVEVPGSDHSFGIDWDFAKGEPTPQSITKIREYLVLQKKVQRRFKQLRRRRPQS